MLPEAFAMHWGNQVPKKRVNGAVPPFPPCTLRVCTGTFFDFLGSSMLPEAFSLHWGNQVPKKRVNGAVPPFLPCTISVCTGTFFDFLGSSMLPEAFALHWGGAQFEPRLVHSKVSRFFFQSPQ
jgi:hypothetical protein